MDGSRASGSRFPVDPWRIRETSFASSRAAADETIFALANGHLGLRGDVEEAAGVAVPGTYVNGFYEATPIVYGEAAYGFARDHQVLLNVADGKRIQLLVDDRPLDLAAGTVETYERVLDLRTGVVERAFRWRSPDGPIVDVASRRLVSLTRGEVAAIELSVRVVSGRPRLRLVSILDPTVRNMTRSDDPRVGAHLPPDALTVTEQGLDGADGWVVQRTRKTGMALVAAVAHEIAGDEASVATARLDGATENGRQVWTLDRRAEPGSQLTLRKFLAYATTRDHPAADLVEHGRRVARTARSAGMAELVAEQRAELDRFWDAADVEIEGDPALQQGIRYNLFSVFQSAGRDGRTSLPAKGLTGEGYDGHYFWDTEVFALPFLTYARPAIARALLAFRVTTLDAARARAAEMDERGALFPWRTIGGSEASAYFEAGTAQYHINADIAHAIASYVRATGDTGFLFDGGAEVVLETARLWASLGTYVASRDGAFSINEVTGPDEYSALVDDNAYTNLMARAHLRYAAALADALPTLDPAGWARIQARVKLERAEVDDWRHAADAMRIPYDRTRGIHMQDASFLDLERWDLAGTPPDRRPLLLHYHPLVIYRHQVLKQPDVVLAQVLRSEDFGLADKKRNFDYYDPLTTGDSSLAPSVQSVAAAELGYDELAYDYFTRTVRIDLDDVQGNVDHGVHIAAMAGSWFALVYGFAGMRDGRESLAFAPRLPARWGRLRFRLRVRGRVLGVTIEPQEVRYELLSGDPLEIVHFERPLELVAGAPAVRSLAPTLEAVVFDLDGVITDTAELHYRAWQRLADEEGFPFDPALNERLKGVGRLDSLGIILDAANVVLPRDAMVALADRKNGYYRELIETITPADLLPGIADLLAELRAAGIGVGIASVSRNAPDVIARLGIADLLDVVVDPASVVRGKPDPEIFLRAAEGLRRRPDHCVGVEDAQAGIDAIRAAGMVSIGVGRGLTGADAVVASTAELSLPMIRGRFV